MQIVNRNTKMANENRFKIRFLLPSEAGRIAQLVSELQTLQKMDGVTRIPDEEDVKVDLCRRDELGNIISNNKGSFIAVAIDQRKLDSGSDDQSYIIGYLIYTQSYSLRHGRMMYLNSFFIEEDYRRMGIGRKFMRFFKLHARLLGNNMFDVPFMNNNHNGQKFYKNMNARLVSDEYHLGMLSI